MKFLPFDRVTFRTRLSPDEIFKRLQGVVEPPRAVRLGVFRRDHDTTLYDGEVHPEGFSISRIIRHKNSFLPSILGTFEPGFDGTHIKATFRLHTFVKILMIIWFMGMGSSAILLPMLNMQPAIPQYFLFITPFMVVVFYAIIMIVFTYDVNRAKKDLLSTNYYFLTFDF